MVRILRLIAMALGLAAATSQAAFHLWTMNELYSNADGTVQFLELTAITGGQQFLAGHDLTSTSGMASRTFTFPADLPGDTSGKRMLIGTQGFAALGVVTPDYIVPNGFFFNAGGSVNFAAADNWNHGALPTDNRSLNRDGSAGVNSPRNFAGQTGTVSAATPLNFQGLWYRSPAESESGWGLNIAHQGDIFFITWFTYDADGSGMWLVGPDVRRTTGNNYTGPLYRTTGPAFNSVPFNPAQIGVTSVGTATLTFTDANNGTFGYVVNNVSQTKAITRQVFSTLPACTAGGTQGATLNFQDLWYAFPAESEAGWGVNLTHQGDIVFVTWFTYDSTNRGMWLVGPATRRTTGDNFTGPLYRTTGPAFSAQPWNPAGVGITEVGTVTLAFTGANAGTFSYVVNTVSQSKAITRQSFGIPATVCR